MKSAPPTRSAEAIASSAVTSARRLGQRDPRRSPRRSCHVRSEPANAKWDTNALIDELAALLVAADAGDDAAEADLRKRYETDSRLAPGGRIQSFSPYGEITDVVLTR
jgi:hypothetical protein